jgi:hypothetical protein
MDIFVVDAVEEEELDVAEDLLGIEGEIVIVREGVIDDTLGDIEDSAGSVPRNVFTTKETPFIARLKFSLMT